MIPTCKDLFNTLSSDDNSFNGFSKVELNMASKSKSSRKVPSSTAIPVVTSTLPQVQVLHALSHQLVHQKLRTLWSSLGRFIIVERKYSIRVFVTL